MNDQLNEYRQGPGRISFFKSKCEPMDNWWSCAEHNFRNSRLRLNMVIEITSQNSPFPKPNTMSKTAKV